MEKKKKERVIPGHLMVLAEEHFKVTANAVRSNLKKGVYEYIVFFEVVLQNFTPVTIDFLINKSDNEWKQRLINVRTKLKEICK